MIFKKKEHKNSKEIDVRELYQDKIISEQLKIVRTNIEFSFFDKEINTMVITSVNQNAGKSTIASNLARTFASQNKKILLIDADMRKPTIHKVFNLENRTGLSTLLTKPNVFLEHIIQETDSENLYILTSGIIPPNPSEMLSSQNLLSLINECRERFDMIIIDAPPMIAVADAQIISGKVDGTIFILNRGIDSKEDVRKCKELVKASNANVIGAIFNREIDKGTHYHYY